MTEPVRACKHCGCTETTPCDGGCSWVMDNVCSQCVPVEAIVGVRYGDLTGLQERCEAQHESLQGAMGDIADILVALGILLEEDAQVSPHLAVTAMILPKIKRLMATDGMVAVAEQELRERSKLLKLPEIDLGGGRKGVLAGRRLPKEFLEGK